MAASPTTEKEGTRILVAMHPAPVEYPQFFTATILEWRKLLQPCKYKAVIIESLRYLVTSKRVLLYGFVIMDNHIHLLWQITAGHSSEGIQRDFLKYTAQQIKKDLQKQHPAVLSYFKVTATDRQYQFWERNALSIELRRDNVFQQKLTYIHENPVRAGLTMLPEKYKWSSASFYHTGIDHWGFLTHYRD